jgi:hypothetical protein
MLLKDELSRWREEAAIKKFGAATVHMLGLGLVMSTDVLRRIVDAAHYSKIKTNADLLKETNWDGSPAEVAEVLKLILCSCPAQPETLLTALTPTQPQDRDGPKAQRQCSKCSQYGHNCTSSLYFLWPQLINNPAST